MTWPQRAREVTPEESAELKRLLGDPPYTIEPVPQGEHFRKTYGLWLEREPDAER